MKNNKVLILLIVMLVLVLAACGGTDAETGAETEAVAQPAEEAAVENDSSEAETAVELGDEVRVEEGGFAFQPAAGYEVTAESVFAELSSANEDTQINIFGTPLMEGMGLDVMFEEFTSDMGSDDTVTLGEREEISVNGLKGFSVTMAGEEEGTAMKGVLLGLGNDTQAVIVLAAAEESVWDSTVKEEVDAMVNSLSLFEIDLSALMGEVVEEPVEEVAETEETEVEEAAEEETATEEEAVEETVAEEEPAAAEFDSVFPIPDDATNFIGEGGEADVNFQTEMTLEDLLTFYRDELTAQELTERDLLTVVDETIFSIVFDGHENGKAIVIQAVDLGEMRNINIRFEEN